MSRDYDNSKRARRAERTADRILQAAEKLVRQKPIGQVTLKEIAGSADVTVQTVLRHHDSRAGVLRAMGESLGEHIRRQRNDVEPGDIEAAIDNVLEHYEAEGDLILRLLSEEASSAIAGEAVKSGRTFHRNWVEMAFGPHLDDEGGETQIDALVVATDLYTWRLLSRDLGRELDAVREVMLHMVRRALGVAP